MKMIFSNDKNDCIDSLTKVLESTASWRRVLVPKFDDPRNLRAAETLENLAVEASSLTDEQWSAIELHFTSGWNSKKWRDGLNQAARSVGFHHRAKGNFFVKVLLQNLSPANAA
jgi:beta-lactamase superfamily II metal-dependent hydrolase